jgi:hypothetical protein
VRRPWLRSPPARVVDVLVFLAVAGTTTGAALAIRSNEQPPLVIALCALAATLPLVVRRRWPFAVLAWVVIAAVLSPVDLPYVLALIVGVYTVGTNRSWRATMATCGVVVLSALVYALAVGTRFGPGDVFGIAVVTVTAAAAGIYIGAKRTNITTLEGARRS